jgi:hypothetical protein
MTGKSPSTPRGARAWAIDVARDERARAVVQWALLVLIWRQAIAAPIRAFLPFAWYLPDLGVGIGFAALTYLGLKNRVVPYLIMVGVLLLLVLYSLMLNPPGAVALSARNFAYVILAVLAGMGVRRGDRRMIIGIVSAGAVAIFGVYYDHFFKVPWSGAIFAGVLQSGDVAREWYGGGGIRRLSGFGISSTDTSVIIAVGALAMCGLTQSRLRVTSALFAAAAIHTLLLTTQKATAGWLIIVLFLAYIVPLLRFRTSGFQAAPVLKIMGIAGLIGCMLVPPLLLGARLGADYSLKAETFDMRTAEVWPRAMPMLGSFPQILSGYGLGGVGQTASIEAISMVDNMFLYTALTLGLPLTLALFAIGARGFFKVSVRDETDFTALTLATIMTLNGITANVLAAGGVGGIYLGFAIGCLLRPTRANRSGPADTAAPRRRRRSRPTSTATRDA